MDFPATLRIDSPDRFARWRPLVQWILVLPQWFVLIPLSWIQSLVAGISWIMIVFRRRMPTGLADIQAMILRYSLRVDAYSGFLTDTYPRCEFDLGGSDPGGSPVVAEYSYDVERRSWPKTFFRPILMIPALIFAILIGIAAVVCHLLAGIWVVIMGRWPSRLRTVVVGSMVVDNRLSCYTLYLTDRYPPFSIK